MTGRYKEIRWKMHEICKWEGCTHRARVKGLCMCHYNRQWNIDNNYGHKYWIKCKKRKKATK